MNILRIAINIILSGILIAGSVYLLFLDSYALHGTLFIGVSRYLLSLSLLLMTGFAGAIARGWIRGDIPMLPPSSFRFDPTYVHPAYQGKLLVRYWYFIAPALICLALAFAFAEDVPITAFHLPPKPLAWEKSSSNPGDGSMGRRWVMTAIPNGFNTFNYTQFLPLAIKHR